MALAASAIIVSVFKKLVFFCGFFLFAFGLGFLLKTPEGLFRFNPPALPVYEVDQENYSINPQELLATINQAREDQDLSPLKENNILDFIAYQRALDMKKTKNFSHEAEGRTYFLLATSFGYNYKLVGENLAMGFKNSERIVKAWLLSEKHRENLLGDFEEIGLASLLGSEGIITVAIFGAPR